MPGLQLAWDSTSLGALKRCPRYYQLAIIQGHTSRSLNVHLFFGIIYHSATERYSHGRAQGKTHDESLNWAVRHALTESWDKVLNRPWDSGDSNKNRWTLIRTIVWYLDQFEHDPVETVILANSKPAIELSFRFEVGISSSTKENYILCGHMDRVGVFQNHTYIIDKKTTKHTLDENYFSQYTPDNQFSLYSFAGQVALSLPIRGVMVDAAQVGVGFSRFQRVIVARNPEQLNEWYKDFKIYLNHAENYAKLGYWPMNEKSCWGCEFRGICSKAPSVREQWIKGSFATRIWDPLQRRGDI